MVHTGELSRFWFGQNDLMNEQKRPNGRT